MKTLGAGIQCIDHHLAVRGPGDFNPAILQVSWNGSHTPGAFTDGAGLWEEIRQLTLAETLGACRAQGEQSLPLTLKIPVQLRKKIKGLRR